MHISNYSRVFEVNEGVVDEDSISGQGVEEPEVSIFDPNAIEVRRGEGSSVKGCGILTSAFATDADKMSVFVDTLVANVLGSLCLSFLVKEDDRVKMGLSPVVPYPPLTRVVGILKITSKRGCDADRLGGGSGSGDGRLVLGEVNGLIAVDAIVGHVWLGEIKDVGYEE